MNYRILQPDDVLQEGDEWRMHFGWNKTKQHHWGEVKKWADWGITFRRPIPDPIEQPLPTPSHITLPPDDYAALVKAKSLKLYVWENVLRSYQAGFAFAYAESPEAARRLVIESLGFEHDDLLQEPKEISAEYGKAIYGSD